MNLGTGKFGGKYHFQQYLTEIASEILVHDYYGHDFQIQLSRELARQRYRHYAYSAAMDSPAGAGPQPMSGGLRLLPWHAGSLIRRCCTAHWPSGAMADAGDAILAAKPDAVISATHPNDILDILRARLPPQLQVIGWAQDISGVAIKAYTESQACR